MAPPPPPDHFFMNHPPFQSYPPFLANFLVPPPPKWLNFWKVLPLPLPPPLHKGGGRGRSNDEYWYCIGIILQKTTEYKLKILMSFFLFHFLLLYVLGFGLWILCISKTNIMFAISLLVNSVQRWYKYMYPKNSGTPKNHKATYHAMSCNNQLEI